MSRDGPGINCDEAMSGVWPFIRRKQEVDRRNVDVFQPFRSLLIRKQTLLRRSMFRKLILILKQMFLRRF